MSVNPWIANSFLDTCAFDPKYYPEDAAAVEIFRLHEVAHLPIVLAHSNQKEINHPNTPAWVKERAARMIYTTGVTLMPAERDRLNRIHAILTGNDKPVNVADDACHIFEARKYGAFFVTTDERLLKLSEDIRTECGVEISRPSQFLELVHSFFRPARR